MLTASSKICEQSGITSFYCLNTGRLKALLRYIASVRKETATIGQRFRSVVK